MMVVVNNMSYVMTMINYREWLLELLMYMWLACGCRSDKWQDLTEEQKNFIGQAVKEDGEFW